MYNDFLRSIPENFSEEELKNTINKASDAFKKLTQGYYVNLDDLTKNAIYPLQSDQSIVINDIEIISLCRHHLLPSFGKCHLVYIPNGYIMGFSRIIKIINALSQRLTLQEILTEDIANLLNRILQPKALGLMISAQHLCMKIDNFTGNSLITTVKLLGKFAEQENGLSEFHALIQSIR